MSKDRMKETHQNKAQNNRGTIEKPTSLPGNKKSSGEERLNLKKLDK